MCAWGGGGYSTDVQVGRCGWGTQGLSLFKTEISNSPTLFKTSISAELNGSQRQQQRKGEKSVFCDVFIN